MRVAKAKAEAAAKAAASAAPGNASGSANTPGQGAPVQGTTSQEAPAAKSDGPQPPKPAPKPAAKTGQGAKAGEGAALSPGALPKKTITPLQASAAPSAP